MEQSTVPAPVTLFDVDESYLFGLVKVKITLEDRRPDMPEGYNLSKYRYLIVFQVAWKKWGLIIWSMRQGTRIFV